MQSQLKQEENTGQEPFVTASVTMLSEASMTSATSLLRWQAVGYYGAYISLGMLTAALGPTLTELAQQTGSRLKEISFLFMARSLGFVLGGVLCARLYDRIKGHPLLAGALFTLATLAGLTPTIPWLGLLLASFLLQGITGSLTGVGANTLLVWSLRGKTGALLGGLHFSWGVGAFLSPLIVAKAMAASGGIVLPYLILAGLALPVCLWLLRLPSPVHEHETHDEISGEINLTFLTLLCCFFFLYTAMEASFGNWIFTYALTTELGDHRSAAYLNSAFWGMLTLGRLLAIPLAMRWRPRTILMLDLSGVLISVLLIISAPHSAKALWVGVCGAGLSLASVFPTAVAFAGRRMKLTGAITGRFFAAASAGAMVLPWMIGQFFTSVGPQMLPYTILGGLLAECGIFAFLMLYPQRFERPPKLPEEIPEVAI